MIELEAHHSHLYPGARGRVLGRAGEGAAVVRFADGSSAQGELRGGVLRLAPYRTAAGTLIGARGWRLSLDGAGFRVAARQA